MRASYQEVQDPFDYCPAANSDGISELSDSRPKRWSNARKLTIISHKATSRLIELSTEIRWKSFARNLRSSLRKIPRFLWKLYIEALLIPAYRPEWARYSNWDPEVYIMTRKERIIQKRKKKLLWETTERTIPKYHIYTKKHPGHPHDHVNCYRICINISGRMYETQLRTLNRYPETLLGNPQRRLPFFDPIEHYYFFDRNRESFEMILYFYQSGGRIRRPCNVSPALFYSELVFFDVGEQFLREYRISEGLEIDEDTTAENQLPQNLLQRKLWLLLEFPQSSTPASTVAIISVLATFLSLVTLCIETLPSFSLTKSRDFIYYGISGEELEEKNATDLRDFFNLIETICVAWFTLEFTSRLTCSPKKLTFCFDVLNVIDFFAILPYFSQLFTTISSEDLVKSNSIDQSSFLSVLRVIRLVRVFRVFKFSRYNQGLRVLGQTLKSSGKVLQMLVLLLAIIVVLFASAVYFSEQGELGPQSAFSSIADSFYWGITTVTTVGYGDLVPQTLLGKLVGAALAIFGVLAIKLPVPVIVSNFNLYYSQMREKRSFRVHVSTDHVEMCPYLPGNGIHPDAPLGYDGTLVIKEVSLVDIETQVDFFPSIFDSKENKNFISV